MPSRISLRSRVAIGVAIGLTAAGAFAVTAQANPDDEAKAAAPSGMNGPYLYLGWGNPPDATSFMKETGTKQLTMAFINANGGCEPAWDGQRPLSGGQDEQTIKAIQDAGGDVTPSFGGWSGNKLGEACSSAQDLAGAYQKVIDAYKLKSIDIDIESTEVENADARQRVIDALKTVKEKNNGIKVYLTFGTTPEGPNQYGKDLVAKGAAAKLDVDGWTLMPFDFDAKVPSMVDATKSSVDGLKDLVAKEYGISEEQAYSKVGFSSMNGKTDKEYENISADDFKKMLEYAKEHKLARVSFWSVNRDPQNEFSKPLAGYTG